MAVICRLLSLTYLFCCIFCTTVSSHNHKSQNLNGFVLQQSVEAQESLRASDPPLAVSSTPHEPEQTPSPSLQELCGGPEDLSACDFVKDGICVLSEGYLRLWQRRRWRGAGLPKGATAEPRWVEGLRIISGGDIEIRGAIIKCTGAARSGTQPSMRLRRLRGSGCSPGRRRSSLCPGLMQRSRRDALFTSNASTQRIELCAGGSIRLLGSARLHCAETLLYAGDSVVVGEAAEITASGTSKVRGSSSSCGFRCSTVDASSGSSFLGAPLDIVARRLKQELAGGPYARGKAPPQGLPQPPQRLTVAGSAACAGATAELEGPTAQAASLQKNQQKTSSETELRGGSHGGMGGIVTDRCEATAFSGLSVS